MNSMIEIKNDDQYLNCKEENCSICLCKLNHEVFTCDNCKNSFHLICMIKWFNESKTCPNVEKNLNI